jgi:hypothetical protein
VLLYNLRAIFLAVHDDTFVACLFGLTTRNLTTLRLRDEWHAPKPIASPQDMSSIFFCQTCPAAPAQLSQEEKPCRPCYQICGRRPKCQVAGHPEPVKCLGGAVFFRTGMRVFGAGGSAQAAKRPERACSRVNRQVRSGRSVAGHSLSQWQSLPVGREVRPGPQAATASAC